MFTWGNLSKQRMEGVDQRLQDCATAVLSASKQWDYTIPWMGGVRTRNEQYELFERGVSNADGIKQVSQHQLGKALDVQPVSFAAGLSKQQVITRQKYFAGEMLRQWHLMHLRGQVPLELALVWGGTFSTIQDLAHFEINHVTRW